MSKPFDYYCFDCEMNLFLEWFTVHDSVWEQTGLGPQDGVLCVGCLEKRIGRRLSVSDFAETQNNQPSEFHSDRLLSRFGLEIAAFDADGNQIPRAQLHPWVEDYDNPTP